MDNTKPESADVVAPRSGPGRLLRQARLDLRLAPEDVAQILHLSSKHITALEMDDYLSLPGDTAQSRQQKAMIYGDNSVLGPMGSIVESCCHLRQDKEAMKK